MTTLFAHEAFTDKGKVTHAVLLAKTLQDARRLHPVVYTVCRQLVSTEKNVFPPAFEQDRPSVPRCKRCIDGIMTQRMKGHEVMKPGFGISEGAAIPEKAPVKAAPVKPTMNLEGRLEQLLALLDGKLGGKIDTQGTIDVTTVLGTPVHADSIVTVNGKRYRLQLSEIDT